jgi:hypothetical protein
MFEEGKKYYEIEIRPLKAEFTPEEQVIIRAFVDKDRPAIEISWGQAEFFKIGGVAGISRWPSLDEERQLRSLVDEVKMKIRVAPLGRDCTSDCDWCSISGDCNFGCSPVFLAADWIYPALTTDEIEARVISAPSFVFFWKLRRESEDVRECVEAYFDVNDLEIVENGALPVKEKQQWCSSDTVTDFCARVAAVLQR